MQVKRVKKPNVKKVRISRAHIMTTDAKYVGPEPVIIGKVDHNDIQYREALNWYNYVADIERGKDWLVEYLKSVGYTKQFVSDVRRAPKHATSPTICWQARMMLNGAVLCDSSMEFFRSRVESNAAVGALIMAETKPAEEKPNIQARIKNKTDELLCEFEEKIDIVIRGGEFNAYEFLLVSIPSTQSVNVVRDYYAKIAEDVSIEDAGNKESYGKRLPFWQNFYKTIVEDCERYVSNSRAKKVRAPRKQKTKTAVDMSKKVKYKKEDAALKTVSVHPSEIIGAQTVWTFNTKYRFICVYHASGPVGITVSGTTMSGFDTERSKQKAARKPEEIIKNLMKAGKVSLRTFIDSIKTAEREPTGRLNEDTLILKVVRNG